MKRCLTFLLVLCALLSIAGPASASPAAYPDEIEYVTRFFSLLHGKTIAVTDVIPMHDGDGNVIAVCVNFTFKAGSGYAVLTLFDYNLIEYSFDGGLPISSRDSVIYTGMLCAYKVINESAAVDIRMDKEVSIAYLRRHKMIADPNFTKPDLEESIERLEERAASPFPTPAPLPDGALPPPKVDGVGIPDTGEALSWAGDIVIALSLALWLFRYTAPHRVFGCPERKNGL